jgi:hypothetical protein
VRPGEALARAPRRARGGRRLNRIEVAVGLRLGIIGKDIGRLIGRIAATVAAAATAAGPPLAAARREVIGGSVDGRFGRGLRDRFDQMADEDRH